MQYNSIGQDFATINDKALNAVKKYFSRILPIYAVVLTVLLGIIAVTIPILSSISERYFVENNIQKSVSEKIEVPHLYSEGLRIFLVLAWKNTL